MESWLHSLQNQILRPPSGGCCHFPEQRIQVHFSAPSSNQEVVRGTVPLLFFPVRSPFNLGFMPIFWTSEDYENVDKLNATIQAEVTHLEAPLSSTMALIIVLMIIFSLVMTSFVTYCFHKWRLKGHKLQTAQEEYQRDQEKYIFQSFTDLIS